MSKERKVLYISKKSPSDDADSLYEDIIDVLYAMDLYADKLHKIVEDKEEEEGSRKMKEIYELVGNRGKSEIKESADRIIKKLENIKSTLGKHKHTPL